MFASSPQQFKIYLTEATNLTKEKQVLLYPDAGAIRNHLILIQYKKAAQLAIDAGFELKVAWWGQISKSQPDIDKYRRVFEIVSFANFFSKARKFAKLTIKQQSLCFFIERRELKIYNIPKTIVDCFVYYWTVGIDVALKSVEDAVLNQRCSVDLILFYAQKRQLEPGMQNDLEKILTYPEQIYTYT